MRRPPTSLYFEDEAAAFALQVAQAAQPGSLLQFTAEHEARQLVVGLGDGETT